MTVIAKCGMCTGTGRRLSTGTGGLIPCDVCAGEGSLTPPADADYDHLTAFGRLAAAHDESRTVKIVLRSGVEVLGVPTEVRSDVVWLHHNKVQLGQNETNVLVFLDEVAAVIGWVV